MSIKLSETEFAIVRALRVQSRSIEELARVVYKGRPMPDHAAKNVATIMRTLILKTAATSEPVKRLSKVGRGHKAVYGID